MTHKRTLNQVLDRDFLEIRARILDLAAALDRLDHAGLEPGQQPDRRIGQIREAIESLLVPEPDRAETVQRLFSLMYDPAWPGRFELKIAREA